jgi:two-component system, chemotaxis family, response regulator Rcp1
MSLPLHILLVDDNPGDADLTRDALESGKVLVRITVVVDGEQALAYLRSQHPFEQAERPDLILLDLNLPGVSGREVLGEIKKDPSLRAIPVVVLSSSDAASDVSRSYDLGANCYITKPVGLAEFQSIVQTVENFWFMVVKLP